MEKKKLIQEVIDTYKIVFILFPVVNIARHVIAGNIGQLTKLDGWSDTIIFMAGYAIICLILLVIQKIKRNN